MRFLSTVKRHFLFNLTGVILLAGLFLTGLLITKYLNGVSYQEFISNKNDNFLLVLRFTSYCLLLLGWKYLLLFIAGHRGIKFSENAIDRIVQARKKVALSIILYEVVIVQNIVGRILEVVL